jgi:hypothetical protein
MMMRRRAIGDRPPPGSEPATKVHDPAAARPVHRLQAKMHNALQNAAMFNPFFTMFSQE